MKLSKRLYLERCKRCLKQREIAKLIGISTPTYVHLEKGEYIRKLNPFTTSKLATYLKCDEDSIIESYKEEIM